MEYGIKCKISLKGSRATRYCNDKDDIIDYVHTITSDMQETIEVSSWTELATIGETYEGEKFIAEIIED